MPPARIPQICVMGSDSPCGIDVNRFFVQVNDGLPTALFIFAIFAAFVSVGLLLAGVLYTLLHSQLIRRLADFIRGQKSKRKNGEL